MDSPSYEDLQKESTEQLYAFVTEKDCSHRKWKALHVLEERRMQPMVEAARKSASAAKYSAIAAVISALVALAALTLNCYSNPLSCGQSEPEQAQKTLSSANRLQK